MLGLTKFNMRLFHFKNFIKKEKLKFENHIGTISRINIFVN